MGLSIVLLWLAAALLSFYAKNLILLLVCGACLAFYALLLVRDFSALRRRLALFLGQELGCEVVAANDARLISGCAAALSSALEALAYKLNAMSWRVRSEKLGASSSASEKEEQQADKAAELLQQFSAQFRCKASALLLPSQTGDLDALRIIVQGPLGNQRRLERYLRGAFQSYFSSADRSELGLHDLALERGNLQWLTLLGLRYSLALPIPEFSRQESLCGVLWLAYDSACSPLEDEVALVKTRLGLLGRELASIYALEDLSRRVQSAQAREKRKDDFIAQVSHDIRSPLNNIRAILNLLNLENIGSEHGDMLQVALQNCDSLSDLVSDIVDFSRHRSGKLEARREVFDLNGLLLEVCDSNRVSAKIKGIELALEDSTKPRPGVKVLADRRQLKRVFQNVLGNGLKFTNSGSVRVQIAQDRSSHYSVLVRDSGCGMDGEQLKSLFEPFSSRSTAGTQEGIGLGLALSKILIELNGGAIEAHSVPGHGSLFEIRIPAAQADIEVESAGASAASLREGFFRTQQQLLAQKTTAAQGPLKQDAPGQILLVDDDQDCVDSLARVLSAEGLSVIRAYSAVDAVSILNFTEVGMVLCDASMPDGGARRVLHYLSGQARSAAVVILTGLDDTGARSQFIALGAAEVWVKPLELDTFRAFWSKLSGASRQVRVA